jgi:hypothetical protein
MLVAQINNFIVLLKPHGLKVFKTRNVYVLLPCDKTMST